MSNYREATGPSAQLPLRYKFIKGGGDREHEEALHQARKDGYRPIMMTVGSSQQIVVLAENPTYVEGRSTAWATRNR
jgi:hypothetical protein